jgi:DNA-binding SARP family transcriptional activator/TolB-like protein
MSVSNFMITKIRYFWVGGTVETSVGFGPEMRPSVIDALDIRLLGTVDVVRNGVSVPLPKSRKLRALLAILVTEGRPVGRSRLCDLLWDLPNDPRSELRWHLSKLRKVVDTPERARILSGEDAIGIDLAGCTVDALELLKMEKDIPSMLSQQAVLSDRYRGTFLGDMDLSGAATSVWLTTQRRRFSSASLAVAKALAKATPTEDPAYEAVVEQWLDLSPFEIDAQHCLLSHLFRQGRIAEADTHLKSTERLFRDEGLPLTGLREAADEARAGCGVARSSMLHPMEDVRITDDTIPTTHLQSRRSSLAVMPFCAMQCDPTNIGIANGLTHDVIVRMAKLRCISIIARGSVQALANQGLNPAEAGLRLGVDYVATGTMWQQSSKMRFDLELVESSNGSIIWTDVCEVSNANSMEALDNLGNWIASALMGEIEQSERNRAILRPPSSLDAWGSHHRGLWHMYRFTKNDNAQAQLYFERAKTLDPTFSRAFAGLSFTHWQSAFQNWSDPAVETENAYAAAAQSLLADEKDPAAHWAMGRALWLRKQNDAAVVSLHESIDLSPNFALGHYSLAFVESQTGDPRAAIRSSDLSRSLSPYDPLMFGILGSRAIAHFRLGEFEQAAEWAKRAAARPNAHINIFGLAALCLSVAGKLSEGRALTTDIHAIKAGYGIKDFLAAFHFEPDQANLLRAAAVQISLN